MAWLMLAPLLLALGCDGLAEAPAADATLPDDGLGLATCKAEGYVLGGPFAPEPSLGNVSREPIGVALDVIVDLRVDSPTYGQYEAVELSPDNHRLLYIPKGFGHGFCTLTDDMVISYKVDAFYAGGAASGLIWNDPDIGIDWPVTDPTMSERDKALGTFADFESPFKMPEE